MCVLIPSAISTSTHTHRTHTEYVFIEISIHLLFWTRKKTKSKNGSMLWFDTSAGPLKVTNSIMKTLENATNDQTLNEKLNTSTHWTSKWVRGKERTRVKSTVPLVLKYAQSTSAPGMAENCFALQTSTSACLRAKKVSMYQRPNANAQHTKHTNYNVKQQQRPE